MKLVVKTLKGSHFDIKVQPNDTIIAVKKNIEDVQGKDNYPCGQQLLIHNGKVLKDETTLTDNKVSEDGFIVVMLSKSKTSGLGANSSQPSTTTAATSNPSVTSAPEAHNPEPTSKAASVPTIATTETSKAASASTTATTEAPAETYVQAASHLVVGNHLEETVQQLLDMGGGNWDRDTVIRALRAAYNNPERAVDYLYSGIPPTAEVAEPVAQFPVDESITGVNPLTETGTGIAAPEALSNEEGAGFGSLDFLRNNQQFQALRSMVQTNPQILQPMLQELGKQNPQLLGLIQDHHAEFLQLLNEPLDGSEGDLFEEPDQDMPHAISVTQEEQEAIERLEAMGFDRALVIEAFLACDHNEELAANYLLEHADDLNDD
ncbi:hypothetical protein V2J09_023450 [Rumex salicifolius]